MIGNATDITYASCGVLIVVYAWGRFNTPRSNRSSTRRALYWSSCAGYMLTALTLFAVLSSVLQLPALRTALFGNADNPSLPAPLIATLGMTTLLSSVPILQRVDAWILSTFLNWGAIPAEAIRRAAMMTPQTFTVSAADVAKLRDFYSDDSFGDTLSNHLRQRDPGGLELSEYRFTRVVKLFNCLQELAGMPRYARFFAETADEFEDLVKRMGFFLRRSDTMLTMAVKLRALEGQSAYEDLMQDRRETFTRTCAEMFRDLASFTARAVLRSEPTEREIVHRLRDIGFNAAEPITEPDFPIHNLTVLGLAVFVYIAVLTVFFSHVSNVPQQQANGMVMALKIALARLATIGMVIWLMQRFAFFRRQPGEPRKYFAYAVCGVIATVVAACICLPFALDNPGGVLVGMHDSVTIIVLSGILSAAVALCCDDWPEDSIAPTLLRLLEAAACAAVMAFGTSFIYFANMLPDSMGTLVGWRIVAWIALPSIMALMIGGFVPHIYRTARRAAAARRTEALRGDVAAQDQPPRLEAAPISTALPAQDRGPRDKNSIGATRTIAGAIHAMQPRQTDVPRERIVAAMHGNHDSQLGYYDD